jgi:hypothetical protein
MAHSAPAALVADGRPTFIREGKPMNKRSTPSGQQAGSKPALEALEDRQAPAPLQAVAGDTTASAAVTGVILTAQQPTITPAAIAQPGTELIFSTPAALDPLLAQMGRFPTPSFAFPASGGHGQSPSLAESTAFFQAPSEPTGAPPAEDVAAAGDDLVWYI